MEKWEKQNYSCWLQSAAFYSASGPQIKSAQPGSGVHVREQVLPGRPRKANGFGVSFWDGAAPPAGSAQLPRCAPKSKGTSRLPVPQFGRVTNVLFWLGFMQLYIYYFMLVGMNLAETFVQKCYRWQAHRYKHSKEVARWHASHCISEACFALFASRNITTVVQI